MKLPVAIVGALAALLFQTLVSAQETTAAKNAQEIRIPKVELREASINESIVFLMKKSLEVDPKKQGVNIALAGKGEPDAKITLSVNNAAVFEILTVVAAQAGMEIKPTETILMLVPKTK